MKSKIHNLVKKIEDLKKSDIKKVIDSKMRNFEELGKKSDDEIFKELCFCLLTANYSAAGGVRIQNAIEEGFLTLSKTELAQKLVELGHRFPNARANYIINARKYKNNLKGKTRDWLVANIKGLGFKEASHFLRNTGNKNVAIIDFHILDLLVKEGLIEKPKVLTPKKYLEIENVLQDLAEATNTHPGELDLYLWYEETGKVIK